MISPFTTPANGSGYLLSWLILSIVSVAVAFHTGSNLGKKLKGRYLATISLMYWIVALAVYFPLSVLPPLDPFKLSFSVFIPPLIFSNIALDIAFLRGYSQKG